MQVIKASPYFEVQPASGTVLPNQSVQLLVRYHPKALGKHNAALPFRVTSELGHPVQEFSLSCCGTSMALANKPKTIGGTDKLPKDFTRAAKYIDGDQMLQSKMTAKARATKTSGKFYERPDIVEAFKDVGAGTQHALSREEYATMKEHKQSYVDTIRAKRNAKSKEYLTRKVCYFLHAKG